MIIRTAKRDPTPGSQFWVARVTRGAAESVRLGVVSDDRLLRAVVFGWLERLTSRFGDEIPWSELKRGMDVDGRSVQVLGPQGIFTPAGLRIPLSITTAPVKRGQARPYRTMSKRMACCVIGTEVVIRNIETMLVSGARMSGRHRLCISMEL